ncbi:trigger factor [Prosthecochloris sp. HL-130-GSB]|uniref:trigger factor n=1 Tax=Prosthecochloris sp. HL-130-GSB TaxID=1974213 RepID=UPI000A1C05DC|nr:trigger factor [Prosthecochloris sp. HL-130-GSB]ARM31531.1 trigger factor [Prosthecochloris sp. HL-130-GSB]
MQHTIKNVSETEQQLEIVLSAEEFNPEVEKEIQDARKNIQIKGFRKGHAPTGLIRKLMGEAIDATVAERLASKHFAEIAEKESIKPASRAQLDEYTFNDGQLTITLSYEVHPEFELKDYSGYSFAEDIYTVTDEDVENEINLILKGHGTLVSVEDAAAEKSDTVIADLVKRDAAGNEVEGQKTENHHFNLEYLPEDNPFKKALTGAKAGDSVSVDIKPEEEDAEKTSYDVTVKEIKRLELPELTADLVKEITSEKFDDVDAFRQDVRQQLEEHFSKKSEQDLLESISSKLIEENPVPVPSGMVDSFENMLLENAKRQFGGQFPKGFDDRELRASMRPNAEKHAQWMLITQKIAQNNNLDVTDEDIKTFAEKEAEKNPSVKAEDLVNTYMSTEFRDYIIDTILKEKIYSLIKSAVTIRGENKALPKHGEQ